MVVQRLHWRGTQVLALPQLIMVLSSDLTACISEHSVEV